MKLTLRELFALTLIAALIVAWWLDHRRMAAEKEELHARPRTIERALQAQLELRDVMVIELYGKLQTAETRLKRSLA
jgi:hypothetical protein